MHHNMEQRESFTTLGLSGNQRADDAVADGYRQQAHWGANWFFWIAGFSIINSIVLLSNGEWNFLVGLGVTQLIDGVVMASEELGAAAVALALILDATVAGFFVVMGLLARRGFTWAFLLGMIAYALDGLLFAYVQGWANVGFHALALFFIYRGLAADGALKKLQAEAAATAHA